MLSTAKSVSQHQIFAGSAIICPTHKPS